LVVSGWWFVAARRVIAVVVCTATLSGCHADDVTQSFASAAIVERSRVSMGSEVHLTAWTADERGALTAFEEAFNEFDRLDALMSVWKPGSEVEQLNRAAGEKPVPISRDMLDVLSMARQASEWTEGKFDVTFGVLSGLWKFDHDLDGNIPTRADVLARLPLIDYRQLEVDVARSTAFLKQKGMRVHLGGIGKGYAVDRASAILRGRGINDFMIQSGGDLYVAGQRGDRPWRAGIQDPRGPEGTSFAAMDLTDSAFTTSGDYERFFMKDGHRYHHIIDPGTGLPATGSRSVTIVARTATLADALDTGIFILGPEKGMALIERLNGVEGVIVTSSNNVLVSSGLARRLVVRSPPTEAP
jgi:thiamine biosynthesis lipoprotein